MHLVGPRDRLAVRLWRGWRGRESASGGISGPLPFCGGLAEQPAWLLAVFGVLDAAEAALKGG